MSQENPNRITLAECETAAAILDGDGSRVKYPAHLDSARERCLRTVEEHRTTQG